MKNFITYLHSNFLNNLFILTIGEWMFIILLISSSSIFKPTSGGNFTLGLWNERVQPTNFRQRKIVSLKRVQGSSNSIQTKPSYSSACPENVKRFRLWDFVSWFSLSALPLEQRVLQHAFVFKSNMHHFMYTYMI